MCCLALKPDLLPNCPPVLVYFFRFLSKETLYVLNKTINSFVKKYIGDLMSDLFVCLAEWVRSRAVMLHCTTSLTDLGSNPGVDAVNQAVHPSGVAKLIAVSIQWLTAVEDCKGKACGCTMAGVWTMQTTSCWFPAVCTGNLRSSVSRLRPQISACTFTFTFKTSTGLLMGGIY
jgi:hypothetical protein